MSVRVAAAEVVLQLLPRGQRAQFERTGRADKEQRPEPASCGPVLTADKPRFDESGSAEPGLSSRVGLRLPKLDWEWAGPASPSAQCSD